MKKLRPRLARPGGLLALLLVFSLVLIACGDSTATSGSAATTSAAATTASATTAAASATTASAGGATTTAASAATTTTAASGAALNGEIKIGLVSPFSGPIGYLGQYLGNSAQIEVDLINARGGVLGKKLVLVTKDDKAAPPDSVTAVQDLLSNDKIAMLIGPSFTANALAVKGVVTDAKVIQTLVTVSGEGVLDSAPYTFRLQQPDTLQSVELPKIMAKQGVKKAAVMGVDDATGKGLSTALIEPLKKVGITIVTTELFKSDEKDLSTRLLKAKDAGADAIVIVTGNATVAAGIPKAMSQTGFKVPLFGVGGLEGYSYAQLGGDPALGTIFVNGYRGWQAGVPAEQQPKAYAEHVKLSIAKFGIQTDASGSKALKGSPLAADGVRVWAQAVNRAGSLDADKVKAEMEKTRLSADEAPGGTPLLITADSHESYRAGTLLFYKWVKKADGTLGFEEVKA